MAIRRKFALKVSFGGSLAYRRYLHCVRMHEDNHVGSKPEGPEYVAFAKQTAVRTLFPSELRTFHVFLRIWRNGMQPKRGKKLASDWQSTILLDVLKVGKSTTYITAPVTVDGGSGNDTVDTRGGTANNVLLGGEGIDLLYGGSGRDLLIGGAGADTLRGGNGDDILIGARTEHDNNFAALASLLAEWGRNDFGYQARIGHLTGTLGGGLNGSLRLNSTTVYDDAAIDQLYGEGEQDWFLYTASGASRDSLRDRKSNEQATDA
jgi:Ca2+-binding RTX toxin-like protein